jgi:hypothetical protein
MASPPWQRHPVCLAKAIRRSETSANRRSGEPGQKGFPADSFRYCRLTLLSRTFSLQTAVAGVSQEECGFLDESVLDSFEMN